MFDLIDTVRPSRIGYPQTRAHGEKHVAMKMGKHWCYFCTVLDTRTKASFCPVTGEAPCPVEVKPQVVLRVRQ